MALEDIRNFTVVAGRWGSAGQPTEEQLREVATAGYTAVVNLGLLDPRYCLADEAGLVASLGLAYRHIPVPFEAPEVAHFLAFVEAMDALEARPAVDAVRARTAMDALETRPAVDALDAAGPAGRVFVHCAANYRVSSFLALYAELRLGWTREEADRHARTFWPLNDAWTTFLERCRAEVLGS